MLETFIIHIFIIYALTTMAIIGTGLYLRTRPSNIALTLIILNTITLATIIFVFAIL